MHLVLMYKQNEMANGNARMNERIKQKMFLERPKIDVLFGYLSNQMLLLKFIIHNTTQKKDCTQDLF